MNTWETILGILVFAVVIAVLYVWGLKKSYTQGTDLERILLSKVRERWYTTSKSMRKSPFLRWLSSAPA